MNFTITIPDDVWQAIRIPEKDKENQVVRELAVTFYDRGILSFGKARSMAGLTKWEFDEELAKRRIIRHYDQDDLENDLKYADF